MPFSRFLLAALSAVLFLPAAASAANTWQVAPPAFGDAAPVSSLPTVVGGGDGATWALWLTIEQRAGVSGSVVVAQRAAPDGTRGPLLRLGTTRAVPTGVLNEEPGSARFSLVPTPTGVAALWLSTTNPDPKATTAALTLTRLNAAGIESTRTIDPAAHLAPKSSLSPEFTSNAAGDVLISWWSASGEPRVQKITAAGVASPFVVLPRAGAIDTPIRVALAGDGTGRVAYRSVDDGLRDDEDPDDGGLRILRLTATGRPADVLPDPSPDDDTPAPLATYVISEDGNRLLSYASFATYGDDIRVTWHEADARTNSPVRDGDLYTALLAPAGADVIEAKTLKFLGKEEGVTDSDTAPGLLETGLAADGTLALIQQRPESLGSENFGIALTRVPKVGQPGPAVLVGGASDPNSVDVLPSLAVAPDGTAVVGWGNVNLGAGGGTPPSPRPAGVVVSPDGTQGTRYTSAAGLAGAFFMGSIPSLWILDGETGVPRVITQSWLPGPTVAGPTPTPDTNAVPTPTPAPAPQPTPPAQAPQPTPPTTQAPAAVPTLTDAKLSKTSFTAGTKVQFTFGSSGAGKAKVVITRATAGRRVGKSCKVQTRKNRKAKACTFDKTVRTLTTDVVAGRASIAFDGKVSGRKLPVGSYKASITVVGPSGLVSKPVVVRFKMKKASAARRR